jgi:hypothetical protein
VSDRTYTAHTPDEWRAVHLAAAKVFILAPEPWHSAWRALQDAAERAHYAGLADLAARRELETMRDEDEVKRAALRAALAHAQERAALAETTVATMGRHNVTVAR